MRKAVMYGEGNVGRRFIGKCLANLDMKSVLCMLHSLFVDQLNKDGHYPVKIELK